MFLLLDAAKLLYNMQKDVHSITTYEVILIIGLLIIFLLLLFLILHDSRKEKEVCLVISSSVSAKQLYMKKLD